jgi:hypothetical protein
VRPAFRHGDKCPHQTARCAIKPQLLRGVTTTTEFRHGCGFRSDCGRQSLFEGNAGRTTNDQE